MISLIDLSKTIKTSSETRVIFDRVSLSLPTNRKIALLGGSGSGKTILLHLLAGLERPSSGRIERRARVSLPVGYARALKLTLSARQNAEFFAKCYRADVKEVVGFVQRISEMGSDFDQPLRDAPLKLRQQFAYTLSYAIPFDVYLIDSAPAAGVPQFREKCLAMFEERLRAAGVVFATSDLRMAQRYCDQALLIRNTKITLHGNVAEAVELLKGTKASLS